MLRRLLGIGRRSPRSIVHIGFHKTGTTSLQHFLGQHRQKLNGNGLAFFEGGHIPNNHVELHVAAMRRDRESSFKLHSGLNGGDVYRTNLRRRVREFSHENSHRTLVFSAEGISLLRHRDEVQRLKDILPGSAQVVAYLREPRDYLASYVAELQKSGIALATEDRDSHAYVAEGTWLTDYEARLRVFCDVFGGRNVTTIDYDQEVARHGSVIPSFLDIIECRNQFSPEDWAGIRLNRREDRTAV